MKQGSQSVFMASRVWNLKFSVDAILGQHSACLGAKCRAEAELTRPRSSRCTTETAKTTAETG